MSANELIERYAKKALQAWKDLPAEQREEERSFVMAFNAGWEEHAAQNSDMNNRLETQTAEIKRLREALEPFARAEHIVASCDDRIRCTLTYPKNATETFTLGSLEAARQALKGTGADHG